MNDVQCPYCDEWQEINHDDGYGFEENETYEQECGNCGKVFAYKTTISFDYDANKADCLNGGEHQWEKTHISPSWWHDARHCTACGLKERGKIDKEKAKREM